MSAAGKQAVLSSQALIESESDLKTLRRIAANGDFTVEANEMGAVRLLAGRVLFVAGPHLNIYNNETLAWFAELGATRFVLPLELSRDILRELQAARPAGMQTEVFAYGRMPLAFSARCFTARHHNLPKDDCQFRCLDDADGLALQTRDKEEFLTLNGIQTQSALVYDLSDSIGELRSLGVDVVRISPQSHNTLAIVEVFSERCAGRAPRSNDCASRRPATATGTACRAWNTGRPHELRAPATARAPRRPSQPPTAMAAVGRAVRRAESAVPAHARR